MSIKSILSPPDFTTKLGERVSYWSYFVGQNIFYNVVTTFMATYLMMNGIDLGKIAVVTLIVKIWDAELYLTKSSSKTVRNVCRGSGSRSDLFRLRPFCSLSYRAVWLSQAS